MVDPFPPSSSDHYYYSLVVCEKPDAARRVADALATGQVEAFKVDGVQAFKFKSGNDNYVVCSALGHLYTVSDSFRGRDVYPIFDLEWFPSHLVDEDAKKKNIENRILAIKTLAAGAKVFINACDYDVEGETIGHNILRYACNGKEKTALRARFSTLTKDELLSAFARAEVDTGMGLARAGRTRHVLDFIWGINLSRALSAALSTAYHGYRTVSIGRVQGPTLGFVVDREIEVRTFVPTPYWVVSALFEKDGIRFEAPSATAKFAKRAEAESIRGSCEGRIGVVSELSKSVFKLAPAPPFNIGDLQKEAYRVFGYTPSRTLQIAERLYLDALISYPRTNSQKLPPTIAYEEILSRLRRLREYDGPIGDLLKRNPLRPKEGDKTDQAHPAVYPTGELPGRRMDPQEGKLFDLITRRFLACFADDAIRERISARIDVEGNEFKLAGRRTLRPGWMKLYIKYTGIEDRLIAAAPLSEGDRLAVIKINCEEKLESHPPRYNQSSLLERMERESIGTKATRAETIATLIKRSYVFGDSLVATDLGLSIIEIMQEYSPQIISTSLTRETEKALEEIENGSGDETELIERVLDLLSKQIAIVKSSETEIGKEISRSAVEANLSQSIVGSCPVCKTGKLRMIRSSKTKKRFVGCTNYPNGCRASAPLPQRGTIKVGEAACKYCGWPVIYVRLRRFPWKLCINMNCESKGEQERKKRDAVQTLQKRS